MSKTDVKVPDIGDYKNVPVIEVLVKDGDHVEKDATLITLESEKATMEVPAPEAGVVRGIKVKVGDKLSQGDVIMALEAEGAAAPANPEPPKPALPAPVAAPAKAEASAALCNCCFTSTTQAVSVAKPRKPTNTKRKIAVHTCAMPRRCDSCEIRLFMGPLDLSVDSQCCH